MSRQDNVCETKEKTLTNYTVIELLCEKLTAFIEAEQIAALQPLLDKLNSTDTPTKILFIKHYLCPKFHGLRNLIQDQLDAVKATVSTASLDKCARYLEALCEVADQ